MHIKGDGNKRLTVQLPHEGRAAALCNKTSADGFIIEVGDEKKEYYEYDFMSGGTKITLAVPCDLMEKCGVPQYGYEPEFQGASQALLIISYFIAQMDARELRGAVSIQTTTADIIRLASGVDDATSVTKRTRRTIMKRIMDGLDTLRFLNFKNKNVYCFGVGAWDINKNTGEIEITLTRKFVNLLLTTGRSVFYPQLIALDARDEFLHRLANLLLGRNPNPKTGRALSVKSICAKMRIPIDEATAGAKRDYRRQLETALDKLVKMDIISEWHYTKQGEITAVPRESIKPREWAEMVLRWEQNE